MDITKSIAVIDQDIVCQGLVELFKLWPFAITGYTNKQQVHNLLFNLSSSVFQHEVYIVGEAFDRDPDICYQMIQKIALLHPQAYIIGYRLMNVEESKFLKAGGKVLIQQDFDQLLDYLLEQVFGFKCVVAFVEDSPFMRKELGGWLKAVAPQYLFIFFATGEELIVRATIRKHLRAYIVDYDLSEAKGILKGPEICLKLRKEEESVIVIGTSADPRGKEFSIDNIPYVSKDNPQGFVDLLDRLLES